MKKQLLLGYDIGSSSVKASVIDADSGVLIKAAVSPKTELKIHSPKPGWAEQSPDTWWEHVVNCTREICSTLESSASEIAAIGISYQMHGLVMVDNQLNVLYPSIIWCDSRAVEIGNKAFDYLGHEFCISHFLNSPGNFTASKLKWVKENLPDIYNKIYKIMLPGDYIALRLSGEIATTISGLSEGIFWDFDNKSLSRELLDYYGIKRELFANLVPSFGMQGELTAIAAEELGLKKGIPITYRAGDQPNNALSLNVLNPGEVAATAGTSGVIYGVAGNNICDRASRINAFAHVNYSEELPNIGLLLCINGTGIQYSWLKQNVFENKYSYNELNKFAAEIKIGSEGLSCIPFGNGAERILKNVNYGAGYSGLNFNIHGKGHLIRAAQEGIAFAFKYGFDLMTEIGTGCTVIRAGDSNLFQSPVFREAFVNICGVELELYNTDGSQGAARGAGIGIGIYDMNNAFKGLSRIETCDPTLELQEQYKQAYNLWKYKLECGLQ